MIRVALGPDAAVGTVVNVNGTDYTVSVTDLTNGYITAAIPVTADGAITIHAQAVDAKVISVPDRCHCNCRYNSSELAGCDYRTRRLER